MYLISGKVNIEPKVYCQMGCGPHRNYLIESKTLEANYIILYSDTKHLILSLDLLYVGEKFTKLLKEELCKFIPIDNMFITASHTHYAPMTDTNKPLLGEASDEYIEDTIKKISKNISLNLITEFHQVEIEYSLYESFQTCKRRLRRFVGLKGNKILFNQVFLGPPRKKTKNSEKDRIEGSLITLKDANGKALAIIWHFPCHPTSLPRSTEFSSHFIGDIRDYLRSINDSSLPVIFLQGFSGDIRPPSQITRPKNLLELLRKTFFGSYFKDFTEQGYKEWINNLKEELDKVIKKNHTSFTYKSEEVSSERLSIPLSEFAETNIQTDKEVTFVKIDMGKLVLIGVSAELVYDYQLYLKKLSADKFLIGVGCLEDVFGYIPTKNMQMGGGYESKDFFPYFGIKALKGDIELKTKYFLKKIVNL